jgi:putative glutamine amidotransferase
VHPSHFDEDVLDPSLPLDAARDAATLPLIPQAIARGIPIFAICRGFQEMNVALGGSLYQAVHAVDGYLDHRGANEGPVEVVYDFVHDIQIVPGGLLSHLLQAPSVRVNSVHGQGVNRMADRLQVEARAPDGVVEAVTVKDAPGFVLGVQWHPEWQAAGNPVSVKLFNAFGNACRNFRDRHRGPDGSV